MNSELFNMIGIGNIDIGYIFAGIAAILLILLILFIVLLVKYFKLKKRYDKFMQGKNASSLEEKIEGVFQDMKILKTNVDKNKKDIRSLFKNMESAFQKVGLVKYDAFNQMGGQLSFSLALLDENNDGFILNSVHSSEGCYSYTKEIKQGSSSISLGEEEQEALRIAMEKGKK